jgi:hypothetical protein
MSHLLTYLARLAAFLQLFLAATNLAAAQTAKPELQLANLHNVYFPDRRPDQVGPSLFGNYISAPPLERFYGLEGDTVTIPFTLRSETADEFALRVKIRLHGEDITSTARPQLFQAQDVRVEGNSNGSCSCPAGRLPVIESGNRMRCAEEAIDTKSPRGCPTAPQRMKIYGTHVRQAPFYTKDPLQPVGTDRATVRLVPNKTELFLIDVPISSSLAKGDLQVAIHAQTAHTRQELLVPVRVLRLRLTDFPAAEVSYWLSENPRDLVSKPTDAPLNGEWGGAWWSEEHWAYLERAAESLRRIGVTSTIVPLFVRNPHGINATPLIGVRCVPQISKAGREAAPARSDAFDNDGKNWKYTFDFTNFHRWIAVFRRAGFRQFEGAHLAANAGQLPNALECDLVADLPHRSGSARKFRFMPRQGADTRNVEGGPATSISASDRERIYRQTFLPAFLDALNIELKKVKISNEYVQHVIDENKPTEEAKVAYSEISTLVRKHLPGIRIIDAMNQYTAPTYHAAIDLPVVHLALLYDDQMDRAGIRTEVETAFTGPRYFYNTAFREGGPNRFLDTNPMDSRAYGWLLLELGYDGMLHWAANAFRYPSARDLEGVKRPADWSPFEYSIGPFPDGSVEPGHAAGSNWILYPGEAGLLGSIRGRRLRDGLLDHWLYVRARAACGRKDECSRQLADILQQLTSNAQEVADFAQDPSRYDHARKVMIEMLEPSSDEQRSPLEKPHRAHEGR